MKRHPYLLAGLVVLVMPFIGCGSTPGSPGSELTGRTSEATSVCGSTTVQGVDVSHYDGTIDWSQVKAAGITFGYAKATESTDFQDPTFQANWTGMQQAGIIRGAYHFFHPEVDAASQAQYVVSFVGALGPNDLPIVCDLEEENGVSDADTLADAITFLQDVTSMTGKTAILYVSPDFLSSYAGLGGFPLWVANYSVSCPDVPSPWTTYTMWQSSASGTVSGIPDACDLDSFNGTVSQLMGLTGSGSSSGSSSGGSSGSSSGGTGSSSGSGSGSSSGGQGSSSGGGSGGGSGSSGGSGGGSGSGSSSGSSGGSGGGSGSSGGSGNSSGGAGSSSGTSGSSSGDVGAGSSSGGTGVPNAGGDDGGSEGNQNIAPSGATGGNGCSVGNVSAPQPSGAWLGGAAVLLFSGVRRRRSRR
jgi:lysozyme